MAAKNLEMKTIKPLAAGLLVLAVFALSGGTAQAAADTWTGAVSANWSDHNWTGGNNPPQTGDSLSFTNATGAGGTALNNNLTTSSFNLSGLTFNSGAAAFTVSGNVFNLNGLVANNSTNLQIINDSFGISLAQTFTTTSGGGNLMLGGNLNDNGAGSSSLTIAGSGTVTLSGANSYSGATTVGGGTLLLNNAAALPRTTTLTVNGGTVDLQGNSAGITGIGAGSISGLITNSASGTGTLTVSNWNTGLNPLIADGPTGLVALNFLSVGNVTGGFMGNNANTFSGGLTLGNAVSGSGYARFQITAVPVNTGVAGNITSSPFGRGTITIGKAATDKAQIRVSTGANCLVLNDIIFNSALGSDTASGAIRVDNCTLTLAGTLTANKAPASLGQNNTGVVFLTGPITGANGLWLVYRNASTMTAILSNYTANANNYQGGTEIDSPHLLVMGNTNQMPNGVNTGNVTNNGSFKLNGYNQTINGLFGAGVVDGVSGTPTLTVGGNDATSAFTGVIKNSGSTLALTKIGSGTQTLSGQNTYSGATTINAGVLQGAVGGSCSNSAVTVAATTGNHALLGVSVTSPSQQWTCSSLTVSNAGTGPGLQFNFGLLTPSTTIAPLNVTGGVAFSNAPAITISGNDLPVSTGNGYPILTWGSGSAPSLTGATLTFAPAVFSGNLLIAGNTLYLQCLGLSTNSISLTVANGTGGGSYSNGSQVSITAADDPPGMVFAEWVINSGNPVIANTIAPSTTLTMPANSAASVTAIFTNIPVPRPIAGQGYSLAWNDEFDGGLKSIDLNNTETNGYKWYVQAPYNTPIPASSFTNPEPSVLRILGGGQPEGNEQLVSSVSMNTGFNLADSDGFYLEGRIRMLSTVYVHTNGWFGFWTRATEQAFPGTMSPWPGTTNGWQNSVEIDLIEYFGGTSYGSGLHNWYGFGPFTDNNAHTLWPGNQYGTYANTTNVWHTYGCLLVPSWRTTNGLGYAKMFFDNVFVTGFSVSWNNSTNLYQGNPNATPTPAGGNVLSASELWHRIICLGTAVSDDPFDVDWIRVWQPVTMTGIGMHTNGFDFCLGDYHATTVVEVATNLANPVWQSLQTNSINSYLTNLNFSSINPLNANPIYFSDPQWTNYPGRFYRLRWP